MLCLNGAAIGAVDEDGRMPIQYATLGHRMAATLALAAAGADVALRWDSGFSVLDWGATHGHVGVLRAAVRHGVDVNAAGSPRRSPLYMAAFCMQPGAIDVLLRAGAEIEQGDGRSRTPLHAAAHQGSLPTVLILLEYGARFHTADWEGGTPLHAATAKAGIGSAEVVDLLLRWGADETATYDDGRTPANECGRD